MIETLSYINYNGVTISLNIKHVLINELKDTQIEKIIEEICEIKNKILKLINDMETNDIYNLRKRVVSNLNTDSITTNIIHNYISYQNKLLEYHYRLDYLKSNCIRNSDYLVDLYNKTCKQLNLVNIEYENLKQIYDQTNNNYLQTEKKQIIKMDALHSELADVIIQRDFLKGINQKNKETIIELEKQLNEIRVTEIERLNIENINYNNQIQFYSYEIQKLLNDRKEITENNTNLQTQFNDLKVDLLKTLGQLDSYKTKTENFKNEKEKLETDILLQNSMYEKKLLEMNNTLLKIQNEKDKLISQVCELIPDYTWNENYGFIHKEYEVINNDNIEI
jgi:hypothetical protein